MTVHGVETTPLAEADLDEIWLSIAGDSIARADKFIDRLTARFVLLAHSPRAGRARPELARGLRSFAVRAYGVFYSLTEEGVLIERVLHGSRDIARLLKR